MGLEMCLPIMADSTLTDNLRILGKGPWLRIPTKDQKTLGAKQFALFTGLMDQCCKDMDVNEVQWIEDGDREGTKSSIASRKRLFKTTT